jgi:uncharacterized protein (DUF2384 family)
MLTTEDKDEIKRIVVETFATSAQPSIRKCERADEIEPFDRWLDMTVQIRDLIVNEGFTELTFVNPKTGEKRIVEAKLVADSIVEITARAIEVFGTREKALRWLKTPVRSLGDRTPISLLNQPGGVSQVQDTLGRVEHGVW